MNTPTKPDNAIPPQSDYARSWSIYKRIAYGDRTPALLDEAKTFPQIIFIK